MSRERIYGTYVNKEARGLNGIFKDKPLYIEGDLMNVFGPQPGYGAPDLPYLAVFKGNPAAINAMDREKYTMEDAPFFYCKMGALGYIIAKKDFEFTGSTP